MACMLGGGENQLIHCIVTICLASSLHGAVGMGTEMFGEVLCNCHLINASLFGIWVKHLLICPWLPLCLFIVTA